MERRRPRTPPERPLVLFMDGHRDTREMYAIALGFLGFEMITEPSPAAAYRRAWLTHPDIIVAEVSGIDGWSLVQNLKGDPRTREIPVVALTADGYSAVRTQAEHEGCAAVFVKPCLPEQLAVALRALSAPNVLQPHESSS